MSDKTYFTLRQKEFILNANKKYNLAHGAVRSGKTVATLFRFMQDAIVCPGNSIYIIGFSLTTIYRNVISLLFESEELKYFSPFCTWSNHNKTLLFGNKSIKCIGAGDEGALGVIQGLTVDLCYCDEMTLYPVNVIDMIDSRLSREHSKLLASMNPKQPDHKIKKWIDRASEGDDLYYELHFTIDDNTFLPTSYKENLQKNLTGLFYKRNFLGQWCMAEGAVYDFFDRKFHVVDGDLPGCEYYIAGIDYGFSNAFACVLIAVSTGQATQTGKRLRVIKEYYWNSKDTHLQKTNSEYIHDLKLFLGDYMPKIYADPSAAAFIHELRKAGFTVIAADNDVYDGIQTVAMLMRDGVLSIKSNCKNTIREIEGYVWDEKRSARGDDAPLKKDDHCVDALRYAVYTHKVPVYTLTGGRNLGRNDEFQAPQTRLFI